MHIETLTEHLLFFVKTKALKSISVFLRHKCAIGFEHKA